MPDHQKDTGPSTTGLAHERQAAAAKVVRDVLGGTQHLRSLKEEYLPKFPKETPELYKARLRTSVLFNATKRTLGSFSGMVFRREPTIGDDVPDQVNELLDNIDLTGRDLATFAKDHFEDAYADGHAGIFVDMQPPVEADDLLEEREAGNRPYVINLRKQDILAFSTMNVGGVTVLTELRYRERLTRKDGPWRETEVDRVRQYWLGTDPEDESETPSVVVRFRVWELDPEKDWPGEGIEDWSVVEGANAPEGGNGVMAISRIPLAVTYTGRTGYLESDPPLLDLALQNIRHYQNDSDNQTLARTAKVQTLVITGQDYESVKTVNVGPGHAIVLEESGADAKWIGADGGSFDVFLDDLTRIETRMAVMGLSQLMSESRAAETAQSKRIDKSESDSQLAGAAKGLNRALDEVLSLMAEWMDIEEGGSVGVNTDFDTEPLDSATFKEFRELWAARGISWETLMEVAKAGDLMPDGFEVEEERSRIADEEGVMLDAETQRMFGGEEGAAPDDEEPQEPEDVAA